MVCAIILSCNSAENIENVVLQARNVLEPDVYVLDRNSTDDTVFRARGIGARLLDSVPEKTGESPVLNALRQVHEMGYTHAVLLNANNPTHRPEQIPMFVSAFWDAPHSIFIASGKQRPRASVSNALLAASAMCPIRDAWNGFRGYPVEDIIELGCIEEDVHFDAEALVRASWAGIGTQHLELEASCPDEMRIGNSPHAILFSLKLFGRMMIRFPSLLRRRLAL